MHNFVNTRISLQAVARATIAAWIICIGISIAPQTALAQMGSYEQQQVIQALRTSQTKMRLEIFDGKNFHPDTDKTTAYNYMVDFINAMNKATGVVNRMTGQARGTTEGQGFIEETNRKLDFARAMQSAFPAFESMKNIHAENTVNSTPQAPDSTTTNTTSGTAPKASADSLPTDAQRATVTVYFEKIDALMATGPFNGTTFAEGTSTAESEAFLKSLSDAGNAAADAFNALPNESKQTDEAKVLRDQIREYQNKKRPIRTAVEEYRNIRGPIEAAAANARLNASKLICSNLKASFDTRNPKFENTVFELSTFAKNEGWEKADKHPSVQGINDDWGSFALEVLEYCKVHDYTALAETNFTCSIWPRSDHVAWCQTANAYATANATVIAENALRAKALGPACEAFSSNVMTRKNLRSMKRLMNAARNTNIYDSKLPELIQFANSIEAQCNTPEYEGIAKIDCDIDEPLGNPSSWCQASTNVISDLRDRIFRVYENPITWDAGIDAVLGNEEKLLRNDGWFTPNTKVTYANLFTYERTLTQAQTNNRSLIETLELLDIDPTKFSTYEDTLDIIDDLEVTIEENAASWRKTRVNEDFTGYVTNLAAEKLVTNWHPNATVQGKWLGSSEWNIERTGLGFIDNRWVSGYVLLELPEDPYCQLHLIFVTENYDGEKFVQSPDIQTRKMRFQECS